MGEVDWKAVMLRVHDVGEEVLDEVVKLGFKSIMAASNDPVEAADVIYTMGRRRGQGFGSEEPLGQSVDAVEALDMYMSDVVMMLEKFLTFIDETRCDPNGPR